jgi:hypothetical protein
MSTPRPPARSAIFASNSPGASYLGLSPHTLPPTADAWQVAKSYTPKQALISFPWYIAAFNNTRYGLVTAYSLDAAPSAVQCEINITSY